MQYFPLSAPPAVKEGTTWWRMALAPQPLSCRLALTSSAGWQAVCGTTEGGPAIHFPAAFKAGHVHTLCLSIRGRPGQTFRIEAHGLATRMNKAVGQFTADGQVLARAEELIDLTCLTSSDGTLSIRLSFLPFHSREESWFLSVDHTNKMSSGTAAGTKPNDELFYIGPAYVETRPVAPEQPISRGHVPAARVSDVWVACQQMAFFRNSLHLELEICRPGTSIVGLRLNSPLPLEAVQWWTPQAMHVVPADGELIPKIPTLPLFTPALTDLVGTDASSSAHTICGLFASYTNFERMPLSDTDRAREILLELRFSDGALRRVPLMQVMTDQSDERSMATIFETALEQVLREGGGKGTFIEVGARGPASARVRKQREDKWNYIGVDYMKDANVDVVADAHRLSSSFAPASVDVVYSAEVMEHLLSPLTFVLEANRILRDGGLFMASVPTIWPLHAEPWDYWRFTSHSWKGLLNQNTGFEILALGEMGNAAVIPALPVKSGMNRMQQSPAPLFCKVIARRIGAATDGTTGWSPELETGSYDHS